ncbi:MAG: glycosyltransferase [Phycisphaerales bacterium]|nr:glycosyltransferase [Phycisphaerales bacterium]
MPAHPPESGVIPRPPAGHFLLEVAWEVCNQVGGIYQVVRSKVPTMAERWRDRYALIGPWVEAKAALEFDPTKPAGWMGRVLGSLANEGLIVRHGRWLVPGNPRVLLVEHQLPRQRLNEVKHTLWQQHQISSPPQDQWIDGAISFGEGVRRLVDRLWMEWNAGGADRRMIAHFHEWLGAVGLPLLRKQGVPVATAFTTHATILGRYMASNEPDFYERLARVKPEVEAVRYGVATQHGIERACAAQAHVMTTVSAVTGEECQYLLGRAPDVIVPNGLSIRQYHAAHEMQIFHAQYKEKINLFTMGHFFPSYSFDLDNTLYFFTSGRFEPRNKGFDLCLEAMARLNAELKASGAGITVVFIIVTQRPVRSLNPQVLEKLGILQELRGVCRTIGEGLQEQLFRRGAAGERIHLDDLVEDYWRLRYKRTQFALRAARLPLIVTHIMEDDQNDPVLVQMRELGLINRPEDPVKVVYHPEFINPVNPLWGMEYEQFVRGCHLGLFPSAYEPWGYTPLESMALGVPAISSDLAGFGRYTAENFLGHEELGLTVLARRGRTFNDAAADLTRKLVDFCRMRRRDRIALRNAVERFSWEFDWDTLGVAYHRAHEIALRRAEHPTPQRPVPAPGP